MIEEESAFNVVTIQVTYEDIRKGIPKSCEFCPVALAIKRYLRPEVRVRVNPPRITFIIDTKPKYEPFIYQVMIPSRVAEFINLFDHRFRMWPFFFLLRLPEMILKERTK